jgi:hypothetical protein
MRCARTDALRQWNEPGKTPETIAIGRWVSDQDGRHIGRAIKQADDERLQFSPLSPLIRRVDESAPAVENRHAHVGGIADLLRVEVERGGRGGVPIGLHDARVNPGPANVSSSRAQGRLTATVYDVNG